MDSGAHPVQHGEAAKRQILLDAAVRKGLQAVADAWILPMLHPRHHGDQALIAGIAAMILRNTVEDYRAQVTALLGRRDQRVLLPHIPHKVWLLCGEADSWSPVSQHEDLQQLLPSSELRVIPAAGHMSTMEQPELVSQALVEWINEPV
jgi:pimeloyl-ACP methyl ester carboxylesterase